jgi:predicted nucleotidyltransferase component of viral defense system
MSFDISKHRNILLMILKDIYSDISISSYLGFKGGTALYLFYNLPRFSLDLDFDLLDEEKKEFVFKKVLEIVKQYGKIKDEAIKKFTIFILLSYEEKTPNIKIEINTRQFGSKYENKVYLGIPMKVMVIEDIFAHKLVAMYERLGKANRDIFDVWFLLKKNFSINKEIVEKRTNMKFKEFLEICIEKLEKLSDKRILSGLGELLDEKTKKWVKTNLKKDTIFLLKLMLESVKNKI